MAEIIQFTTDLNPEDFLLNPDAVVGDVEPGTVQEDNVLILDGTEMEGAVATGAGNDKVWIQNGSYFVSLGAGDDALLYTANNLDGTKNYVRGGGDNDLLVLDLAGVENSRAIFDAIKAEYDPDNIYEDTIYLPGGIIDLGVFLKSYGFSAETELKLAGIERLLIKYNQPPVGINDLYTTDEDTVLSVAAEPYGLLQNDTDPDSDPLTVTEINGNEANVGVQITLSSGALLTANADGSFIYDPNEQFEHLPSGQNATDSFEYTVSDGQETAMATVIITIEGRNDPAIIGGDTTGTVKEDTQLTASGVLTITDVDEGETEFDPEEINSDYGTFNIYSNGHWEYELSNNSPAVQSLKEGQVVEDHFEVSSVDGTAHQDITITINGVNDEPIATTDIKSGYKSNPVTIDVLANDTDTDGDPLSIDSVTQPSNGSVNINPDNTLTYTPNSGFAGKDVFTYDVSDGQGGISTGTVKVIVNDLPVPEKMLFVSHRDGDVEIYVMNSDGSNQTNLTLSNFADVSPVWSPDGSKIAFASNRDGNYEIYVMNSDGSNQINLTNNAAFDYLPVWSPDGSKIAFASNRDGDYEIHVMNSDGSNPLNITNNVEFDTDPVWSPDGTKIAFVSYRDGNNEICVVNSDGSNPLNITNNVALGTDPVWSPDGTKIAFRSNRDGNYEIYVMNSDGSNPINLTDNAASDYLPVWSPDGTKIAFMSNRDGNYEIHVMDSDGSNPLSITDNVAFDTDPVWSPDGTEIAFRSNRDGNYEIYKINEDGSGLTRLTSVAGADYIQEWKLNTSYSPSTLSLDDQEINLNEVRDSELEQIVLSDVVPDQTMTLSAEDVLRVSTSSDQLIIRGDTTDTVELTDYGSWTSTGTQEIDGVTYNVFTSGDATLLIENVITVSDVSLI